MAGTTGSIGESLMSGMMQLDDLTNINSSELEQLLKSFPGYSINTSGDGTNSSSDIQRLLAAASAQTENQQQVQNSAAAAGSAAQLYTGAYTQPTQATAQETQATLYQGQATLNQGQVTLNQGQVTSRRGGSSRRSSGKLSAQANPPGNAGEPYIEITEQPRTKGLRFRYECEGRSAGSIPGENSTAEKKTFPAIKIHNHSGPAVVVVSCVTKDVPKPKPHPHALVGKDCTKGVCTVRVRDTTVVTFPHLGIQCAKKKDVEEHIRQRKEINVDPFQTGFGHVKDIDLNIVRLCFQVFLPGPEGKFTRIVTPVCSKAILDKKAHNELIICRIDHTSGRARGGDEVFLLCEKVNKDDITVNFYEQDETGATIWEDQADFGQGDVHRQLAIVFKTPPYKDRAIRSPKQVYLQLKRPSDQEVSESILFTYMPEDQDPHQIAEKRKRKCQQLGEFINKGASAPPAATQQPTLRDRIIAKATRIKQEQVEPRYGGMPGTANQSVNQSANVFGVVNTEITTSFASAAQMAATSGTTQQLSTVPPFSTLSGVPMTSMAEGQGQMVDSGAGQGATSSMYSLNASSQGPIISDVNFGQSETLDMAVFNMYLNDVPTSGDAEMLSFGSCDLLNTDYDPNVAATESVMADPRGKNNS